MLWVRANALMHHLRTSLVRQWLVLCASMQVAQVRFLVRELRSHMLCGVAKK